MRCICKEEHWNNFFVGNIYHYKEEISVGGFQVFLVDNNNRNCHSFSFYIFDKHFYKENELRKLKLDKINESK